MKRVCLIATAGLLLGCATPQPPTGGPEDRHPPRLLRTDPPDGATGIRRAEIQLWFDEWVDPASVEQALELVPYPPSPLRIQVSGRRIRVRMPGLEPERTYVLILTTDLRDLRGNRLQSPIELAFSTGTNLDTLTLFGSVRMASTGQAPPSSWTVALFRHNGESPLGERADYLSQTGLEGSFRLRFLSPGTYRIIAFEDRNRNRRPDRGEPIAVPDRARIVVPGDSLPRPLLGVLPPPPPLRLAGAALRGPDRIEVRFSAPWQAACPSWILEEPSGTRYELTGWYRSGSTLAHLQSARPLPAGSYRITVRGLRDSLDNPVEELSGTFLLRPPPAGSGASAPASARLSPADTLSLLPTDSLRLELSVPLPRESPPLLQIWAENEPLPYILRPGEPTRCGRLPRIWWVHPRTRWPAGAGLRIRSDTLGLSERTYRILRADEGAELSGQVLTNRTHPVEIWLFCSDTPEPVRRLRFRGNGQFRFENLRPGRYRIFVFEDRNDNGRWDGGEAFGEPAEAALWSDPLLLRARWEQAGLILDLR
jgi:uncharacterized protein (DUF2141 family)|nr:MAG: hypothetical protein KatS3mg041_1515 [Bacteroidota bacterium]